MVIPGLPGVGEGGGTNVVVVVAISRPGGNYQQVEVDGTGHDLTLREDCKATKTVRMVTQGIKYQQDLLTLVQHCAYLARITSCLTRPRGVAVRTTAYRKRKSILVDKGRQHPAHIVPIERACQ